jgi:XapX domain-containing protein
MRHEDIHMKMYLISLAAGVLVGVIYSVLNVRAPAPPLIALVGLFGILAGQQVIPISKQMLAGKAFDSACIQSKVPSHIFGQLPGRQTAEQTNPIPEETRS